MRAEKLRGLDANDLQRQVEEAQEQLFRFRFQMGMGQAEGLKKYRGLKKDRARMLTVLGEKARAGEVPDAPARPMAAPPATAKPSRFGRFGFKKKSADKKN